MEWYEYLFWFASFIIGGIALYASLHGLFITKQVRSNTETLSKYVKRKTKLDELRKNEQSILYNMQYELDTISIDGIYETSSRNNLLRVCSVLEKYKDVLDEKQNSDRIQLENAANSIDPILREITDSLSRLLGSLETEIKPINGGNNDVETN